MKLGLLQWTRVSADGWYQVKLFLERASGFSMDALHVIVGVLLQLAIAALFRTSVARLLPLLADCHDTDPTPLSALVLPGRQNIPRVRALVDFLKASCQ